MEGTEPGTGGVDVRHSELSQVQCPGRGAEPRSMSMGRMCVSLGMRELWTDLRFEFIFFQDEFASEDNRGNLF